MAAKDICIVPAYERPEMLVVCLNLLNACWGAGEIHFIVSLDNHVGRPPHKDYQTVVNKFAQKMQIELRMLRPHQYHGNSRNVLTAYAQALGHGSEYIFLVEEDVMVAPDFFQWSRNALEMGEFFCSVAALNVRRKDLNPPIRVSNPGEDPLPLEQWVYSSRSDYASLGVGWKHDKLKSILKYAEPGYFSNQTEYVQREFADSRFKREFCEQDGLILRIMEREKGASVWPYAPRAFHLGWYGYNRPKGAQFRGSVWEKASQIQAIMFDRNLVNERSADYKDIYPCSLTPFEGPLVLDKEYP